MNCIILLLLLSCCSGWGNGGCCGMSDGPGSGSRMSGRGGDCGRQAHDDGCGRPQGRQGTGRREPERCCEEESSRRMADDCGCGQEERDRRDAPGMIPPPWQEHTKFPRLDSGEDCEE